MPISSNEIILGLAVIVLLGLLAYQLKSIDHIGLIAGIAVGLIILAGGGWPWLIIIMFFFTVSALSTRLRYDYKRRLGFGQEKGGARGWRNTLANGGVAAASAILSLYSNDPLIAAAFLGSMATSTADTLATEIGLLSRSRPRLITNLRQKVGAGTSGGISLLGEAMVIVGSLMIGGLAFLLGVSTLPLLAVLSVSLLGGFVGSSFDSLLGATVQGIHRCTVCGTVTEGSLHHDKPTVKIKGLKIIGNNAVNFLSTGMGALTAAALVYLI